MHREVTRKEIWDLPLGTTVFVMHKETNRVEEYKHSFVGRWHALVNQYREHSYTVINLFHAYLDDHYMHSERKRIWTEEYNEAYAMRRFEEIEKEFFPYKFYVNE